MPVGTVIIWTLDTMPEGSDNGKWLECNGQPVDAAAYPKLATLMNVTPNYQGVFLRGYGSQTYIQNNGTSIGNTATTYSSGLIGVTQGDAIRNITGYIGSIYNIWDAVPSYRESGALYSWQENHSSSDIYGGNNSDSNIGIGINTSLIIPTANEIRPVNKAVRYLIKAK